jgi:hypothetical protein
VNKPSPITRSIDWIKIRFGKNWSWLHILALLFAISSSHLSLGQQAKDTLYFYNTTKIVGKLLTINLGRIEFDADGVGIITIKNTKITSITAVSRSFRVETLAGKELKGYLARSDKPGMVWIHAAEGSEEIYIEEISDLVFFGKSFNSGLTGNVSSGFSYTKSSGIGRFNLDGVLKYNTSRGQTRVEGDMIITYDSVKAETERANLSMGYEYTLAPLWGAIFILKYQRNIELGLDRRWQQVLGAGKQFLLNKHQQVVVISGLAINQERNLEGAELNSMEILVQGNYDFFSFSNPNIVLSLVESGFVSVTESGRIRFDGDISLDYEIISDFYINLQFYHNYDSRSPATDEPNIDFGFVAGLRYKF